MAMRRLMSSMLLRLMRASSGIASLLRGATVMHRRLGLLLGRLPMKIWDAIWICGRTVRLIVMSPIIVRMTILAAGRLRDIWNNLHTTWNHACGPSTTSRVRRGCWTTESLSQLLHKRLPHVISSNVNSIRYSKYDERSFS